MKAMTKRFVVAFFVAMFMVTTIFLGLTTHKVLADFDCLTLTTFSTPDQKHFCQNELNQIEAQLTDLLNKQKEQQKQTGTLKGDVAYLISQINALKAKIKARSLVIAQLGVSINEKVSKIESLSEKINREHESLAQLLRNTNEFDNENILNLVLSDTTISNFYSDLESYSSIKQSIKASVEEITGVKIETETQKKNLVSEQNAQQDAKAQLETAQKKMSQNESDKKQLLAISKEKEGAYQKLSAEKKARADKIRSALFSLAGISTKIEFGTALKYANEARDKTGVDPAFLLAILTQESNLGAGVGKCNITGSPLWDSIMPGPDEYQTYLSNGKTCRNSNSSCSSRDDQTPFKEIVNRLGANINNLALSCPIKSAGPWGGAMGPAQFIPSTWKLLENRIDSMLGVSASNPWAPRDAFMASAIYLTDLGAVGDSASAQTRAACKYYGSGGSTCSYGRSVAKFKSNIQSNIDLLSN